MTGGPRGEGKGTTCGKADASEKAGQVQIQCVREIAEGGKSGVTVRANSVSWGHTTKDPASHPRNTYIILNVMGSHRRFEGHGVTRSVHSGGSAKAGLERKNQGVGKGPESVLYLERGKEIWYLSRWKLGDSLKVCRWPNIVAKWNRLLMEYRVYVGGWGQGGVDVCGFHVSMCRNHTQ